MRRTLQEWANFLNMYVFMNADGSIRASEEKPHLTGSRDVGRSNKAIVSVTIYWDVSSANLIEIPRDVVDFDEFSKVPIGSIIREHYYIGWDTSLKKPKNNE